MSQRLNYKIHCFILVALHAVKRLTNPALNVFYLGFNERILNIQSGYRGRKGNGNRYPSFVNKENCQSEPPTESCGEEKKIQEFDGKGKKNRMTMERIVLQISYEVSNEVRGCLGLSHDSYRFLILLNDAFYLHKL
jgi:hypothetical protein